MTARAALSISEILLRGSDLLKACPDFTLVGRDNELIELSSILMRMKKRNLIVTGRGGVGTSSIILGIQDSKKLLHTPVDIVGKRFFWLVTDKLFESGDTKVINALFERVRQTLARTKESVLVIEEADDFVKAAQNNGCTNLINGLMGDLKASAYQAIFETTDETLGELLKCDSDVQEFCTLYEVKEPNSANLRLILAEALKALERHHGVKISPSALDAAAILSEKYKLPELRAQPDAAISLLDHALTDCCREAHAQPQHVVSLKAELKRENGSAKSAEITRAIQEAQRAWDERQKEVRLLYHELSGAEDEVRKLEDEIEQIRSAQMEKAQSVEQAGSRAGEGQGLGGFSTMMAGANLDTPVIAAIKSRIKKLEELVKTSSDAYKRKVAEIYASLTISDTHVLKSFSTLSGIPVDKLNEDEKAKLRNLGEVLAARVIGQEEPTSEAAKAVKRSRLGLKMPNKPSGTFLFLGPSGVGKTELAKALAEALGVPLLRFDMSEYMEKHAVAKLIGAPPGYEGYEHGGILTNAARRNPYSVVLFDEIEKAHTDVFNLMLQLLDDARLTDSRGLTASFKDAIVIMTTNIGSPHFLDETIGFDESKELALAELRQQYRPEFLGRFGGNIYCFKRLNSTVLEAIARKDLGRINGLIAAQGLQIEMPSEDLCAMIKDRYVSREGARSILGFIDRNITSGIADLVLGDAPIKGRVLARYDLEQREVKLSFVS